MTAQFQQLCELIGEVLEDARSTTINLGKFILLFTYINFLFPIITNDEIVDFFSYLLVTNFDSINVTITAPQCH